MCFKFTKTRHRLVLYNRSESAASRQPETNVKTTGAQEQTGRTGKPPLTEWGEASLEERMKTTREGSIYGRHNSGKGKIRLQKELRLLIS